MGDLIAALVDPVPYSTIYDPACGSGGPLIKARLREIARERELKAALMEHLFTHGTRGEPTKITEIGEMPESWQIKH